MCKAWRLTMRYLDVLVPVKNEADNVEELVRRIHTSLTEAGISYGVIFIDDHSDDTTVEVINRLAKQYPVKAYRKQGKKGKAYSILEGMNYSSADTLAMIDGDLQYPPEALVEMYEKSNQHGVVVAKRQKYHDSKTRKIFSKTFKYLFGKLLFNFNCDVQSGLKLFKREILERVDEKDVSGWTLDIPLLHTAVDMGHSIGEVDIDFAKRQSGVSKVNTLKATAEIGSQALALKFRPKKIYPLKQIKRQMKGSGVSYNSKQYITHTTLHPDRSAIKVLSTGQKIWMWSLLVSLLVLLIWNFLIGLQVVVAVLSFIYFIDVIFNFYLIYKSLHQPPEISVSKEELDQLKDSELPTYTILCPLYREAAVLPIFLDSIAKMDYPKNKLEVMLLLEEDDKETQEIATTMKLPSYVKVVVVPDSQPKTKPKACNYGLTQATGEYLVIYDAEDIPDPLQLKKAFLAFKKSDRNVICLQAKLNYHNPYQNVLTRLFTAEYSLWFDVTLTGLQSISTTIPLGGTSNHFRTQDLLALEGWDPFNVTEDCDLGIRLFHEGYKTAIIDSTTLEEANSNVRNWIRQRSRWIKGYMQTYLVHMRNPFDLVKQQGWHAFVFQLVVGGKIAFIFINPFLWVMTIAYFAFRPIVGEAIESLYPVYIFYMAGFSLVFGNFLFMYYYMIGVAKREQWSLMKFVFLVPLYWLMVSWAGFIALYQLIVKPHYWEKTIHGLHLNKALEKVAASTVIKHEEPFIQEKKVLDTKPKPRWLQSLIGNKHIIISGSVLICTIVFSNVVNFIYNAYLGRRISVEDFGIISLFGSFSYIIYIPIYALGGVITKRTAYLSGKYSQSVAKTYFNKVNAVAIKLGIILTILWILVTPFLAAYFHINTILPFLLFTPVWLLGIMVINIKSYIEGTLSFAKSAVGLAIGSLGKLVLTLLLIEQGLPQLVLIAIPFASLVELMIVSWFMSRDRVKPSDEKVAGFDWRYFYSSIITGLSSISFLALDVILAKHFLNPTDAGEYSLLSFIGKITFFLTSLVSPFILPLIANRHGANKSTKETFFVLFGMTLIITISSFVGLGLFGSLFVPVLFGANGASIVEFLPLYVLTVALFSVTTPVVTYFLAKDEYLYVSAGFVVALSQLILTSIFHANLTQFVAVMFVVSLLNLVSIFVVFILKTHYPIALKNVQDFISLIFPTETFGSREINLASKRILIFNWRDTSHVWAGGAEAYIHELAKRWVKEGHRVTVFCGNDGKNPRNEVIDGVQMVRRGGFYTVYIWAFLYYILRFRGLFDVVIDSENGIPFFTPLFVRVPKFLLIHHIHQDVFRKHLKFPFSWIAMFLEAKLMPWVYRNQQIITVSESSKKEILKLGLGTAESIEVIHPGIDPSRFRQLKKTMYPSFLYLGRLQPYKNIDVAIKAFKAVAEKYPEARLTIAGFGEMSMVLKNLAQKLNISQQVTFTGKVSQEEKSKLMAEHWVFVQPSMLEGWGITVIEANASATPVIASDVNGLKDSVADKKTGLLVKPKDILAFSEAMITLIEDKKVRDEYTKQALQWSKKYDWKNSADKFSETMHRVLEGRLLLKRKFAFIKST